MNIAFDIFMLYPELIPVANSIPEIDEGFSTILSFVMSRLKVLEDEIDKEENGGDEKGTVILMKPPPEHAGKFVVFLGYSDSLTDKMVNSFSKEDMDYLFGLLSNIQNKWQQ